MADWVVVSERDTETGGRQVTVSVIPGGRHITVRVPRSQATSTGVRRAIEAAIETTPANRPTP